MSWECVLLIVNVEFLRPACSLPERFGIQTTDEEGAGDDLLVYHT